MDFRIGRDIAQYAALPTEEKPAITGFSRLEPLPAAAPLEPGLQACVADPLWLLSRQWQLNEFQGEDAGTPIFTNLALEGEPIYGFIPGRNGDPNTLQAIDGDSPPVEAMVEAEPALERHPRLNAEAGLQLLRMVANEKLAGVAAALQGGYSFSIAAPPDPDTDVRGTLWHVALSQRSIDAAKLGAALQPFMGADGKLSGVPAELAGVDNNQLRELLARWLIWLDAFVLEGLPVNPNWIPNRLEYGFSLASTGANQTSRLRAEQYCDGRLDWHSFTVDALNVAVANAAPKPFTIEINRRPPGPVRYGGMPADRYWEFEDARVNFAGVEAGLADTMRLLVTEFALTFGNDWFIIPIEVPAQQRAASAKLPWLAPAGANYRVSRFTVTDTFGVTANVPASKNSDNTVWSMFELGDVSQGGQRPDHMFVPSSCWESLDGPPLEHVMLVRDEMANLAWAIEKRVPGTSGESLDRTREAAQLAFRQQFTLEADDPLLIYRLATPVPANWIPLLPTRQGAQLADPLVIQLQRAGMRRFYSVEQALFDADPDYQQFIDKLKALAQDAVDPFIANLGEQNGIVIFEFSARGTLLRNDPTLPINDAANEQMLIEEEEVPRAGVALKRAFQYARTPDGRAYLWIGRNKTVGRGEGSSGLRYDSAAPRQVAF